MSSPQDPSCRSYSQALLYFKGFHSIQVHRIAHELWCSGRKVREGADTALLTTQCAFAPFHHLSSLLITSLL